MQYPPHPYADRICSNTRARNGIGEELPYGHYVIDYSREYDYDVGDSLSTVFGLGAMLMSSAGVEVLGQITVPRSLRKDRLLKVFFRGVPGDGHIFRVV